MLESPRRLREKYGFSATQPIIYVSTAPSFFPLVSTAACLRGVEMRFRGQYRFSPRGLVAQVVSQRYPMVVPYRRYLKALRAFADVNGAMLIAKTRAKHRDPAYLTDYVDALIDDRCFFPFTTLELLHIASLYVGFYSATVLEAMALGLYSFTAMFVPVELAEPAASWRAWSQYFHRNPGSLWNMPGVSSLLDGTSKECLQQLDAFSCASLKDFQCDEQARQKVLSQFMGCLGSSSQRCMEILADYDPERLTASGAAVTVA